MTQPVVNTNFYAHTPSNLKSQISNLKSYNFARFNKTPSLLERLKKRWKANGFQLVLILATFALGGSLTGFIGKKLMNQLPVSHPVLYFIIYIAIITILWPMSVLLISILTGQLTFFKKYINRLGNRLFKRKKQES